MKQYIVCVPGAWRRLARKRGLFSVAWRNGYNVANISAG